MSTVFYELDYTDIIQKKAAITLNQPVLLQQVMPQEGDTAVSGQDRMRSYGYDIGSLKLIDVDLRDSAQVSSSLLDAGIRWSDPTLVITECVLVCMLCFVFLYHCIITHLDHFHTCIHQI